MRVVVGLMPDVLVSCFCMGLLLCSSSLRREEDGDELYPKRYTRCLLVSWRRLYSTRWGRVHRCGRRRYLRLIDLTFHLHRTVALLSLGQSDFTEVIVSHVGADTEASVLRRDQSQLTTLGGNPLLQPFEVNQRPNCCSSGIVCVELTAN